MGKSLLETHSTAPSVREGVASNMRTKSIERIPGKMFWWTASLIVALMVGVMLVNLAAGAPALAHQQQNNLETIETTNRPAAPELAQSIQDELEATEDPASTWAPYKILHTYPQGEGKAKIEWQTHVVRPGLRATEYEIQWDRNKFASNTVDGSKISINRWYYENGYIYYNETLSGLNTGDQGYRIWNLRGQLTGKSPFLTAKFG